MGGSIYYQRFKRIMALNSVEVQIKTIHPRYVVAARLDLLIWKTIGISFLSIFRLITVSKHNSRLVYGSNFFPPQFIKRLLGIKSISWFPDFQVHDFPEFFSRSQVKRRVRFENKLIDYSDLIVVQNNFDKIRLHKIAPRKRVCVLSFFEDHISHPKSDSIKDIKAHCKKEYILVAAQSWAHKRVDEVVQAYDQSDQKIGLIVIGKLFDPRNTAYTKRLKQLMSDSSANFLGYVSNSEKFELFARCKALLNYSLYEGWNSSVEEALAFNKPIILSDTSFHRDQVSNAMFVNSKQELSDIFSKKMPIECNVDFSHELMRRKIIVKDFVKELKAL
ncbi:glycosyltransferase [Roseobacter sp. HKCCD5988]|uniref:glycosyltransferase n=1 Tax=Roseobacter sp. HKCCD5988 TaxID=3120338 RepID=UPI0030EE8895